MTPRGRAIGLALFITFLWSTSWVIIKFGLADLPPLAFAGLRYAAASLCLLPFVLRPERLAALRRLPARRWLALAALGLLYYAATQGAQFVGLKHLPAAAVSLTLNFTTALVTALGVRLLAERPTGWQWAGVAVNLAGVLIYFLPLTLTGKQTFGLGVALGGTLANALSSILGRRVNRGRDLDAVTVTGVSMGIGSAALLALGLGLEGWPALRPIHWFYVAWLAVVNTALAFTLWNQTLRALTASESSLLNSTLLIQIAVLAWLFLGEALTGKEIAGLALAGLGVVIVQLARPHNP